MKLFAATLCVLCMALFVGCGNVWLAGDAMTAATCSTVDAFDFAARVRGDANLPRVVSLYADENAQQWRSFVRSARNDKAWGPKLPDEADANK